MDAHAYAQFLTLERDHWWFRGRRAVYLGLLRAVLGSQRVERALDVGCGVGGFLPELARVAERVAGCEPDPGAALHAAARGVAPVVVAASERLPWRDGAFDLVCLFDVLEHLDDDGAALGEVRRVLRPGGRCLASVPAWPMLYANNDRVAHHRRRYTRASLARLFRERGFEVERNTCANVILFPAIAAAIFTLKGAEGLGVLPRESKHTNLSWRLPRVMHSVLARVFRAELVFSRRIDSPVGHSIAIVARRR